VARLLSFPARSTAIAVKVCWVAARLSKVTGFEQPGKPWPSRLQWKLTVGSASVKLKVALVELLGSGGPLMTGGGGGVVSTIHAQDVTALSFSRSWHCRVGSREDEDDQESDADAQHHDDSCDHDFVPAPIEEAQRESWYSPHGRERSPDCDQREGERDRDGHHHRIVRGRRAAERRSSSKRGRALGV
jgi:hypothetical protein